MKRKATSVEPVARKNGAPEEEVDEEEEEEEEDDEFVLSLKPKGTLPIRMVYDSAKWEVSLSLDKTTKGVVGVPPLNLSVKSIQPIDADQRSSLHVFLTRTSGVDNHTMLDAHIPLRRDGDTDELCMRMDTYLGVMMPNEGTSPFTGAVLKRQPAPASGAKRKRGDADTYSMRVSIETGKDADLPPIANNSLFPIETGNLMMEQTSVSVSKEWLGMQSEYFSQLFYGGYMENQQEVVSIQDVPEDEGRLLIDCLYARRPNLTLDETRSMLTLADRFSLVALMRKCIESLLKQGHVSMGDTDIDRAQFILMADRAKSTRALGGILGTFKTPSELKEAVDAVSASLSHASMVVVFERMAALALAAVRELVVERRPKVFFKFGSKRLVVQLLNDVVPKTADRFFAIAGRKYKAGNDLVVAFDKYSRVELNGKEYGKFEAPLQWTEGLTERHRPTETGIYMAARIDPAFAECSLYVVKHNTVFDFELTYFAKFTEGKHVLDKQPTGARFHFGVY